MPSAQMLREMQRNEVTRLMPGAQPYTLTDVQQNPLARMLPLYRWQAQVYRMGERVPPSALADHGPVWEAVEWVLDGFATLQSRVNLQRDFTLISIAATCNVNTRGGFRIQMYDIKKRYRFADRGISFANFAGPVGGPPVAPLANTSLSAFFLREPYRFEVPDSQIYIECQNFEPTQNRVSAAFYGQVLRFNEPGPSFPGGQTTSWEWSDSIQRIHQHRERHRHHT